MAIKDLPRPHLQKSLFQARYKPKLSFYEKLLPAARQFEEMPQWQTTGLSTTLFDFDRHCSMGIAHDAFSYSQDSSDLQLESASISKIIDVLPSALDVSKFVRFGLRRWHLIPLNYSFEIATSIVDLKLFNHNEKLQTFMPPNLVDLTYLAIREENDCRARINVSPARRKEIPLLIPYDQEHHLRAEERDALYLEIKKNYPEVAIFVEIDYFRLGEDLSPKDANTFYGAAKNRISELVKRLNEYLFATKLEV